jgi:hypothetical protein
VRVGLHGGSQGGKLAQHFVQHFAKVTVQVDEGGLLRLCPFEDFIVALAQFSQDFVR